MTKRMTSKSDTVRDRDWSKFSTEKQFEFVTYNLDREYTKRKMKPCAHSQVSLLVSKLSRPSREREAKGLFRNILRVNSVFVIFCGPECVCGSPSVNK
jgi:hypothetical protein